MSRDSGSETSTSQGRKVMSRVSKASVLIASLSLGGCAADYVTGSNAPVNLYIAAIEGTNGPVLRSDVEPALPDFASVLLAVRTKNPNVDISQKVAMAVLIERYEVRFFRSDGRNVEGVDVPHRISGAVRFPIDVESSGTSELLLEVVRSQAKLEPPLRNLRFNNTNTDTGFGSGAIILTTFAEITLHGKTIAGQSVTANGILQVDFADFQ
jgi:hypothetical protein